MQSIESHNFVNLRIYLLQPRLNKYLVKSLYGILLMIPQGKAYQALYKRLSHMNMIYKLDYYNENISVEDQINLNKEEIEFYMKIFERTHLKKRLKYNDNNESEIDDDEEGIDSNLFETINENDNEN